jgi:hypothetical protein
MRIDEAAMVMGEDGAGAALMVRRSDGQFAFGCIDPRIARAARVASIRGVLRGLSQDPSKADEPRLVELRRG